MWQREQCHQVELRMAIIYHFLIFLFLLHNLFNLWFQILKKNNYTEMSVLVKCLLCRNFFTRMNEIFVLFPLSKSWGKKLFSGAFFCNSQCKTSKSTAYIFTFSVYFPYVCIEICGVRFLVNTLSKFMHHEHENRSQHDFWIYLLLFD